MANQVLLSVDYIPNPSIGKALSLADIYVGIVDLDPKVVGNQKQISVLQENGTTIEVSQPISTSAGGVPLYNGSPVTILVDGSYSLRIDDSTGAQVYYVPSNYETTEDILIRLEPVESITALRAITYTPTDGQVVSVLGYSASTENRDWQFQWDATSTESDDNGLIIKVTAIATGRFKRLIELDTYDPEMFGIFGDSDGTAGNGTEYSTQLRAMFVSIPSGSIIDFPPGLIYRVTSGVDVTKNNIRINGNNAFLFQDGPSTRSLTIPTVSSSYDATLIVWNGSESQNIVLLTGGATGECVDGKMTVVEAAAIDDFECYNLGIMSNSIAYEGPLAVGMSLLGVRRGTVKGCTFDTVGAENLQFRVEDVTVEDNVFIGAWQDAMAGLLGGLTSIKYNRFYECSIPMEIGVNNGAISYNQIETYDKEGNGALFMSSGGGYNSNVNVEISNNTIRGRYKSFIQASENSSNPDAFKSLVIKSNVLRGKGAAAGDWIIIDQAGGQYIVSDNVFDDSETTVNTNGFIQFTGTDLTGTYTIKGNVAHVSTAHVVNFIQTTGLTVETTIKDNSTVFKGSGAYRDTSDSVYKNAIRFGTLNPDYLQSSNNSIGLDSTPNTSVGTRLVVLDDSFQTLAPPGARTITNIWATNTFMLLNEGPGVVTLQFSGGIIDTIGSVDVVLAVGETVGFTTTGTGTGVKQIYAKQ